MHDYLIVGSGFFGATFARLAKDAGYSVLVIEKNKHIGGNAYTEMREGIPVALFGPHCFHTNSEKIWSFINKFAKFNHYRHQVKAINNGTIYSLPFNMMTYHQVFGCTSPKRAQVELDKRRIKIENPENFEDWCLSEFGHELYELLIYGYTKKHWKKDPKNLPISIIQRLPFRMTYNDFYFDDIYQGMPIGGYTPLFEKMLDGIEVLTNNNFFDGWQNNWRKYAKKLLFTGCLDQYFNYCFGELEYRSLYFETYVFEGDFQGVGQMNYTNEKVPYTRIIEHKHFYFQDLPKTVITYEYPDDWDRTKVPYYPIRTGVNVALHERYLEEIKKEPDILIGGRLGTYEYLDLDTCIEKAMELAKKEL
jgi:UDP-galactopyranose mutase